MDELPCPELFVRYTSRAVGISCNIFCISAEGTHFSKGLPQSVTLVALLVLLV